MLQKIARGDVNEYVATVIEGWTFQKMRNELDSNSALQHDKAGMTDTDLLKAIGAPDDVIAQASAEGLFFPDSYLFDKGTSDIAVYKRAYKLMQQRLAEAWALPAHRICQDALRGADHGVDRRKGNQARCRPAAGCSCVREPVAHWHAAAK